VVGAEGKGLSRLVRERCDETIRIPMMGRLASLNAAVAAAVVMAWMSAEG
jgi:23S rRNA (guanosine2251-2'-O)-methyltransferase